MFLTGAEALGARVRCILLVPPSSSPSETPRGALFYLFVTGGHRLLQVFFGTLLNFIFPENSASPGTAAGYRLVQKALWFIWGQHLLAFSTQQLCSGRAVLGGCG